MLEARDPGNRHLGKVLCIAAKTGSVLILRAKMNCEEATTDHSEKRPEGGISLSLRPTVDSEHGVEEQGVKEESCR